MSANTEKENKKNYLIVILLSVMIVLLVIWIVLSLRSTYLIQGAEEGIENLATMSQEELESEKARQEIRGMIIENNLLVDPWQQVSSYATVFTVIVAIIGTFTTIWKQISEQRSARKQSEVESLRRLDDKFTSIIKDLGAENSSLKASAAVSLLTFLREEYSQFHEQVYLVLLANLKIDHDPAVNRLLIQAFEKALRLKLKRIDKSGVGEALDLTCTMLYRIDLSGLDLSSADIAFADLRLANCYGSNLYRVKGYEADLEKGKFTNANLEEARLNGAILEKAHFHNAKLVSATLKDADLRCAQFYGASLQSAHLEEADLRGACFEQANINDAYFIGAELTDETLASIKKAYHWQDAHFDDDIKVKLEKTL